MPLDEEILLEIFALTDIYTVLTLSRVSDSNICFSQSLDLDISKVTTRFRAIASTKQLWLLFVKQLFSPGLIDVPSDEILESWSCDELTSMVKRAVSGPRTWFPDSPTAPTLIRQFVVPLEDNRAFSTVLLPGGRHVSTGVLGSFNTTASLDLDPSKFRVQNKIVEDYFGYILSNETDPENLNWIPFLVDWRTGQYIALNCLETKPDFRILPGYVLLTSPRSVPLSVRIYSILSLQQLWRPLSDFNLENATPESAITPTAVFSLRGTAPTDDYQYQVQSFVAESLLRRNTYLLRVADSSLGSRWTASTHRLDLSDSRTPRCTLLSTSNHLKNLWMWRTVSRAGYTFDSSSLSKNGVRTVRLDDGEEKYIPFDGTRRSRHAVLPHNGGLVVLHKSCAEIFYYY
ncbi:hypothetical protein MVEN_01369000 [Mycena venus]|uniref:F-box domain-containing protein n=1 Tax=Mycena venus TaxID=2733690 RepID=A0A8H6XYF9_9AGAR|nr:hypothetical protein MVEN_01369000 [Mycena venus]